MGGPNKNNSDKKNPAKGSVWVDLTKTIVIKNPAKGEQGSSHQKESYQKILLRGEYGWTTKMEDNQNRGRLK